MRHKVIPQDSIVFFDLDDTLIKTTAFHEGAFKHALKILKDKGINISEEELRNIHDNLYDVIKREENMFKGYLKVLGSRYSDQISEDQVKTLAETAFQRYEDFRTNNCQKYIPHGVIDTLELLLARNIQVGILSQGNEKAQRRKLECLNLGRYINPELSHFSKSKTLSFYKSIRELYKGKDLWMIGDRENNDIILPMHAGFNAIRILGNSKYATKQNRINEYEWYPDFTEFLKKLKEDN